MEMTQPERRKRVEDLDKKSNEEILSLIAGLTAECEEKRKSCAKLQEEVQLIQNNLAERNTARSAKVAEYSETVDLLPLAVKTNSAKQRVEELEMELKDVKDSKEERALRRRELEENTRVLHKERIRLEANYNALVENMTNVKSQAESLAKSHPELPSRPLTRREADERLDDLVRQYLPERLFKSRRHDDQ